MYNEILRVLPKSEVLNSNGRPIWCKPFNENGFWYIDTNMGRPHAGTLMDWRDDEVRKERYLLFSEYGISWVAYNLEF